MSSSLPNPPPPSQPVAIPLDGTSSAWDRISAWASENKAIVYTIAGMAVVVTGAGAVYYMNSASVCLMTSLSFPLPCLLLAASLFQASKMANMALSIRARTD